MQYYHRRSPRKRAGKHQKTLSSPYRDLLGLLLLPSSFLCVELYLRHGIICTQTYGLWISLMWSLTLSAILLLLPKNAARVAYGITYYFLAAFAVVQIGCHRILGHMIWLSDILHAGEGAEYTGAVFDVLTPRFWLGSAVLLTLGVFVILLMPSFRRRWFSRCILTVLAAATLFGSNAIVKKCTYYDPNSNRDAADATVFRLTTNNYGIYSTMYNAEKTFTVCGYYQLLEQNVYRHHIQPLLPSYKRQLASRKKTAKKFLTQHDSTQTNDMTGILKGKNVILVLMETMDDFLVNKETTPTIYQMMNEGINFTNFYTPVYSSIHTFNTEFCVNTGFFLPTSGKSALYYSGNDFSESMPSLFKKRGYSVNAFHYNSPVFYNRGVMLPAIGYDAYNSYEDYIKDSNNPNDPQLFDECFMLKNKKLNHLMFGSKHFFDYIITRNAHAPYTYQDAFAKSALKLHPEFKGKYGNEALDVISCKARVMDDMFAKLLKELQKNGQLQNTVIIGFGDHYAYTMKDQSLVMKLSKVDNTYLEMKTPCFIWSYGMKPVTVSKTLNTADLAPTVLNLFREKSGYQYLGQDAFDSNYPGYVVFSDGSLDCGQRSLFQRLHYGRTEKRCR